MPEVRGQRSEARDWLTDKTLSGASVGFLPPPRPSPETRYARFQGRETTGPRGCLADQDGLPLSAARGEVGGGYATAREAKQTFVSQSASDFRPRTGVASALSAFPFSSVSAGCARVLGIEKAPALEVRPGLSEFTVTRSLQQRPLRNRDASRSRGNTRCSGQRPRRLRRPRRVGSAAAPGYACHTHRKQPCRNDRTP